jgi:hypothetical protein
LPRVSEVTCLLYSQEERQDLHPWGSGVLLRVGDQAFLITAAHVADRATQKHLYLGSSENLVPVEGPQFVTNLPPTGARTDDKLDLALIHLTDAVRDQLPEAAFLGPTELDRDPGPRADEIFLVAGFPHTKQSRRLPGNKLDSSLEGVVARSAPIEEYAATGVDPALSLLLVYNYKDVWRPTGGNTAATLRGMSGCGVWVLEGVESEFSYPPRLSAVLIEWRRKGQKRVLATRIALVLATVQRYFPEVWPHLRNGWA